MDAFVEWLRATPLSQAIVFRIWIWPLCETLHFMGLALIIGIAGFFDLRLMGFFKQIAVDGQKTLQSIQRTLNSLQRNPQQLIFGPKSNDVSTNIPQTRTLRRCRLQRSEPCDQGHR